MHRHSMNLAMTQRVVSERAGRRWGGLLLALVVMTGCGVQPPDDTNARAEDAKRDRRIEELAREVADLRDEVARLRAEAAAENEESRRALENENADLRQELVRLYAAQFQGGMPAAPRLVPRPDALGLDFRDMLDEAAAMSAPPEDVPQTDEPETGSLVTVVKEWGRTPDQAQALGNGASSLKGMICAVPTGLTEPMLTAIARQLRAQCDAFDNINIVVFDDMDAARAYAESNRDASGRRVLRISRERAAGHDVMLRVQGDKSTEIPAAR